MLEGQGGWGGGEQPQNLTSNWAALKLFVVAKYLPASGLPKERS